MRRPFQFFKHVWHRPAAWIRRSPMLGFRWLNHWRSLAVIATPDIHRAAANRRRPSTRLRSVWAGISLVWLTTLAIGCSSSKLYDSDWPRPANHSGDSLFEAAKQQQNQDSQRSFWGAANWRD